ncbi:glycosyltransferase family 4 protein [Cuneatibacter sp. NSJ-177]|uniref:glycosyltransferase family 4 protein n=1 Tax=Cuneatibacter sp. NSJ-177 TaxID=2931401 RepID=UPI001FD3C042|nr:glycosyltransferase family 4 protein [Cuneatibacter sp. NSJ-177]MCJ7836930.1 glycosyltransferase family 4 protein [Cuneatibacter sp. NSJ-177]
MKIVMVTQMDIFGELNYGGVIEARRHYNLLTKILGPDSVYTVIISNNCKRKQAQDNRNYVWQKRSQWSVVYNCLCLRVEMGKRIEEEVAEYINSLDIDAVFFEASFWWGVEKRLKPEIRTILFMHNIEKNYAWNRVIHKSVLTLPRFFACWYNETRMIRYSDQILCLNERDRMLIRKIYHRGVDLVLPISFEDHFPGEIDVDVPKNGKNLLFVGSNFPPNYQGIVWFVKNVMPKVNGILSIVGKGMEKCREELECENVRVVGTVDNTAQFYEQADVVVMPIFWGDGMKVKTAEAMMYGKTIIATKEALEGYETEGVEGIFECSTKEDFVTTINKVLQDPQFRGVNLSVRKLFIEKYDTAVCAQRFRKFILEEKERCDYNKDKA